MPPSPLSAEKAFEAECPLVGPRIGWKAGVGTSLDGDTLRFVYCAKRLNNIPLSHLWISANCGENKYFCLVSLLEITRKQLLKGPHGIQLLGGFK